MAHRYLVALPRGNQQVFLSWRLLASDAPDASFFIERLDDTTWTRVHQTPVVDTTSFLDQ
ncbi:MAG: hypothetical protein HOH77_00465, partial [Candidatus Latescibacteria bacterium]|nr:hypothetical protein [Candidatus Latescibacterota bacterium]